MFGFVVISLFTGFFGAGSFPEDADAQVSQPLCISVSGQACSTNGACASGSSTVAGFTCPNGQVCCALNPCNAAYCKNSACAAGDLQVIACQSSTCNSGQYYCVPNSLTSTSPQAINFTNPLAFNTVEQVLDSILGTLRSIIVILSLVFIVIGAVLYITSAGDEGRMKTAKGAITASVIGLAIGLAAPSFLKEIGSVLGWGAVNSSAVAGAATLSQIAANVLNFLLSIVGVLAIIMLVVGGIMYLTAAGDEDRIDSGKKIVKYSIIGIVVALAALVIVSQIAAFF